MLCGIYGILPQVALWGKGKLCLKGTTQALMTHRSLQTFHENRKKTVVSREDKRVAEMRFICMCRLCYYLSQPSAKPSIAKVRKKTKWD